MTNFSKSGIQRSSRRKLVDPSHHVVRDTPYSTLLQRGGGGVTQVGNVERQLLSIFFVRLCALEASRTNQSGLAPRNGLNSTSAMSMIVRASLGMADTADLNGSGMGDASRTPPIAVRTALAPLSVTAGIYVQRQDSSDRGGGCG